MEQAKSLLFDSTRIDPKTGGILTFQWKGWIQIAFLPNETWSGITANRWVFSDENGAAPGGIETLYRINANVVEFSPGLVHITRAKVTIPAGFFRIWREDEKILMEQFPNNGRGIYHQIVLTKMGDSYDRFK